MLTFLLFLSTLFVAYANGGNDNFKGVATLYGSGVATYKTAISVATLATFAGSLASILLAGTLIKAFSGHGLVPDPIAASPHFLMSVAVGAGSAVILATVTGFPISTTHSLTGGLVGAGFAAVGDGLNLSYLGSSVLAPLLISPILAVAMTIPLYTLLHRLRLRAKLSEDACVCLGELNVGLGSGTAAIADSRRAILTIDQAEICRTSYAGSFVGISLQKLVDSGHYVSASAVSFARGLNDTPKIAALLFAAQALDLRFGILAIALAMAVGGLISARKVAQTMSCRIAQMNDGQAFTANIVTAVLVIFASRLGLPVSTTHVSVGAISGIGMVNRSASGKTLAGILSSWLLTLPTAAAGGAGCYILLAAYAA